jgi:hypothetical protein
MISLWRKFWLKRRQKGTSSRASEQRERRRMVLEQLESRWTPTFTLVGTAGDDVFEFSADALSSTLTLNGSSQSFLHVLENDFRLVGNGGNDRVTLRGSAATAPQIARLAPQSGQWTSPSYSVAVSGMQSITAHGNPSDIALLSDSSSDDVFTATPTSSSLLGAGYRNEVLGFERVEATASTWNDSAAMSDSPGDDTFVGYVDFSFLTGAGYITKASGFDRVDTYGSTGYDSATFSDSAGDDYFVVEGSLGYLMSQGTPYLVAHGYDRVEAYASTGNDTAELSDSAGDDYFRANPGFGYIAGADLAYITRSGYVSKAIGFDRIDAHSRFGGSDTAELYDSAGDDFFQGTREYSGLAGAGYSIRVNGFRRVDGFASSGFDATALIGSASTENFISVPDFSIILSDKTLKAYGFDRVQLDLGVTNSSETLYVKDAAGDDYVSIQDGAVYLNRAGYFLAVFGNISQIDVVATTGNDEAVLIGGGIETDFTGVGSQRIARLTGSGATGLFEWEVSNFDSVRGYGRGIIGLQRTDDCIISDPVSSNYFVEVFVNGLLVEVYWTDLNQPGAVPKLVYSCHNFKSHRISHQNNLDNRHVARFGPRQIGVTLRRIATDVFVPEGDDVRTVEF